LKKNDIYFYQPTYRVKRNPAKLKRVKILEVSGNRAKVEFLDQLCGGPATVMIKNLREAT